MLKLYSCKQYQLIIYREPPVDSGTNYGFISWIPNWLTLNYLYALYGNWLCWGVGVWISHNNITLHWFVARFEKHFHWKINCWKTYQGSIAVRTINYSPALKRTSALVFHCNSNHNSYPDRNKVWHLSCFES